MFEHISGHDRLLRIKVTLRKSQSSGYQKRPRGQNGKFPQYSILSFLTSNIYPIIYFHNSITKINVYYPKYPLTRPESGIGSRCDFPANLLPRIASCCMLQIYIHIIMWSQQFITNNHIYDLTSKNYYYALTS